MKPTPTHVALLMSAAGLSLSFPAFGLAHDDADGRTNIALTFGVPARHEDACQAPGPDALGVCRLAGADHDVSAAANGAATALSAAAADEPRQDLDPAWSHPVFEAYSASLGLLLDAPRAAVDDAQQAVGGEGGERSERGSADTASAGPSPLVDPTVRIPDSGGSAPAPAIDEVDPLDPSSIERVLNILAEIAGSRAEAPAPASSTVEALSATQRSPEPVAVGPTIPSVAAAVADTSAAAAAPTDGIGSLACPIERLDAANDIVVAGHSEKVLMSLAELLSDEGPTSGGLAVPTGKKVVASHSEKVLETLALFQSSKADKPARSAMAMPAMGPDEPVTSPAAESDQLPAAQATPVIAYQADQAPVSIDEQGAALAAPVAAPGQSEADSMSTGKLTVQVPAHRSPMGAGVVALSTDALDAVRGGFVTDDGLKVSFGIERAVYLNGNLVTTTSLNVTDLSKISGGQAQVTTAGTGSLALVQSGLGNTFLPGAISQTAAGLVIQNTLDNQKIQTITRIDAVVNSSGIIRSMNLQSSMRSAVIDSLRR